MTSQSILKFEGREVRLITQEGEPTWIAQEVCEILGITKHRDAIQRLDEDEKGRPVIVDTPGGPQETATVNEAGLYSLILRSRKPEAKVFKRWITHEVLPSLRKTGMYIVPGADEQTIFSGALEFARQFTSLENRLSQIEAAQHDAVMLSTTERVEPLAVLPGMTNANGVKMAARLFCQMSNTKPSAVWAMVYTELEFRYGIRIGARKKRAGWKGSTLEFAIMDGHADKLYAILDSMTQRFINLRAA